MIAILGSNNSYKVPTVEDVSVLYSKENDGANGHMETLRIYTESKELGRSIVLETERWSIDSIEDFIEVLKDFANRSDIK